MTQEAPGPVWIPKGKPRMDLVNNGAGVDSIEDTSLIGGAQLLEGGAVQTAAWPRKSVQQVWD